MLPSGADRVCIGSGHTVARTLEMITNNCVAGEKTRFTMALSGSVCAYTDGRAAIHSDCSATRSNWRSRGYARSCGLRLGCGSACVVGLFRDVTCLGLPCRRAGGLPSAVLWWLVGQVAAGQPKAARIGCQAVVMAAAQRQVASMLAGVGGRRG